ncbi:MAG: nucleotidyltransferase family protein [Maribacter sp.]|nr:nucleotidyltransferase family protein [Maribacter sp.]MBT8315037.1 nucleotidyltransferase family protein [Maribacter sp.]
MPAARNIALVILAAGASSRMQQPKQLLAWGRSTLLGNAINMALDSHADDVYVVLGNKSEMIKEHCSTSNVHWLYNKNWKRGMGSSISCAINHILGSKKRYTGILITLCDQPLIDSEYLNEMIDTLINGDRGIVATAYNNRSGVPVLFHNTYFDKLSKLDNDFGAKKIIAANLQDVFAIDPKGKEKDLDTAEEYQTALKNMNL